MKKVISLLFLLVVLHAWAQKMDHIPGEILVQATHSNLQKVLSNKSGKVSIERCLSPEMNIWKLKLDINMVDEYEVLANLQRNPLIGVAQFNHKVYLRDTLPNDSLINEQWQYVNDGSNGGVVDADLDADLAWEITTGGVTATGDTIVVCVVDDGIDTNHIDFEDNLWVNHGEIPDNGIDDDSNGYIDDYRGWNIALKNDNIHGGSHGTPVSGIIGAKGNNNTGVAGVNWNVKVMVLKNDFDTNEAAVIEAYSYPLKMRRLYNQTNGAKGAFVVATNSSWGVDTGLPSEAPLWCAFYDSLGMEGIISCGATANFDYDVDVDGDLPTACPSPYLISVTNMDRADNKVNFAAFGKTTIDLGAFGDDAYTTSVGNTYSGFGGTSGATPHVAGAVALIYSLPCSKLMDLAKKEPHLAALLVKSAILSQVDSNASLQDITVTGGRLNLYKSLKFLQETCDSGFCYAPFSLLAQNITDTSAELSWSALTDTAITLAFRNAKDSIWTEISDSGISLYTLDGLKPCQEYEVKIRNKCAGGWSEYSDAIEFKTDGCGFCTSVNYCPSYASNGNVAWIENVAIGSASNTSEGGNGYQANLTLMNFLDASKTYDLEVTPGYSGINYKSFISVWIDYDQDGFFEDEELVIDNDSTEGNTVSTNFRMNELALAGVTRMRVSMKYPNPVTNGCEIFSIGEVEDYCIELGGNIGIAESENRVLDIYPNPTEGVFQLKLKSKSSANIQIFNIQGELIKEQSNFGKKEVNITLGEEVESGVYIVKVVQQDHIFVNRVIKN